MSRPDKKIDLEDINIKAVIAFSLLTIVFLLTLMFYLNFAR